MIKFIFPIVNFAADHAKEKLRRKTSKAKIRQCEGRGEVLQIP